jgi:DNA-binding IclR family transcriptional regulator
MESSTEPSDNTANHRDGTVRSVQRAARIITALAEHPAPMGVLELSAKVKLSPASVHRMLTTLISVGWVDQNSITAKYRLGTRILGIGSTGLITSPIVQNGRPFLTRLASRTGYHAALSTLVGMRVIHLARVAGKESGTPDFEPGVSQPAHAMADGKLLMAYLSKAERQYLYEVDHLTAYTARTITDKDALEKELELIRERGYASDAFERFEATRGVSVPILDRDGQPLLAMLCIGAIDVDPEHETWLIREMQSVAAEMSDQFAIVGDMPTTSTEFAKYNLN